MSNIGNAPDANMNRGDVASYLQTLPPGILQRVYQQPLSCLAVLRLLTPLAQQILMRLIYTSDERALRWTELTQWMSPHDSSIIKKLEKEMKLLSQLALFLPVEEHESKMDLDSSDVGSSYRLSDAFRYGLQQTFSSSITLVPAGLLMLSENPHHSSPTENELDRYAGERWEAVLHFMVGSSSGDVAPTDKESNAPSERLLMLLHSSELMAKLDDAYPLAASNLRITKQGFQFLVCDLRTQLWTLLLQYVELAERLHLDRVDMLHLFLQLGLLQVGQEYAMEGLKEQQLSLLNDLCYIGLLYPQRKAKSQRKLFYPTRLATILSTSNNVAIESPKSVGASKHQDGFLIVETNYRVYAYTRSPLQIAILSLFVQLRCRLPNMVVGILTRESVRNALVKGITAAQIIQYLSAHAHPQMKSSSDSSLLPLTILDQLRLWEMERNRLHMTRGYLYKNFTDEADFEATRKYAHDLNCLVWQTQKSQQASPSMVIKADAHQLVRNFVKERLAEREAAA